MKPATHALIDDNTPGVNRRSFFKTLGLGTSAAMAMTGEAAAAARATFVQSNVNRASEPSALKVTDLHVAVVERRADDVSLFASTQSGAGRSARSTTAPARPTRLSLKSRVLGETPSRSMVFRNLKRFGSRPGGQRRCGSRWR